MRSAVTIIAPLIFAFFLVSCGGGGGLSGTYTCEKDALGQTGIFKFKGNGSGTFTYGNSKSKLFDNIELSYIEKGDTILITLKGVGGEAESMTISPDKKTINYKASQYHKQ